MKRKISSSASLGKVSKKVRRAIVARCFEVWRRSTDRTSSQNLHLKRRRTAVPAQHRHVGGTTKHNYIILFYRINFSSPPHHRPVPDHRVHLNPVYRGQEASTFVAQDTKSYRNAEPPDIRIVKMGRRDAYLQEYIPHRSRRTRTS